MRYPLKLIIKKGKARKDGTAIIYLQYCHSESQKPLF